MLFKNLETGLTWEVTNADRIKELQDSDNYVIVAEEQPKKTSIKKKEAVQEWFHAAKCWNGY